MAGDSHQRQSLFKVLLTVGNDKSYVKHCFYSIMILQMWSWNYQRKLLVIFKDKQNHFNCFVICRNGNTAGEENPVWCYPEANWSLFSLYDKILLNLPSFNIKMFAIITKKTAFYTGTLMTQLLNWLPIEKALAIWLLHYLKVM